MQQAQYVAKRTFIDLTEGFKFPWDKPQCESTNIYSVEGGKREDNEKRTFGALAPLANFAVSKAEAVGEGLFKVTCNFEAEKAHILSELQQSVSNLYFSGTGCAQDKFALIEEGHSLIENWAKWSSSIVVKPIQWGGKCCLPKTLKLNCDIIEKPSNCFEAFSSVFGKKISWGFSSAGGALGSAPSTSDFFSSTGSTASLSSKKSFFDIFEKIIDKKGILPNFCWDCDCTTSSTSIKSSTEVPPSSTEVPPSSTEVPPSSTEVPPTSEAPSSSTEVPPTSSEVPPTSSEVPPSSSEVPPSSSEVPPSSSEVPPSSSEVPPSSSEVPPSSSEVPPSSSEVPPSSSEVPPSSTEVPPSSSEVPPCSSKVPPTSEIPSSEVPPSSTEVPPSSTEAPPASSEVPSTECNGVSCTPDVTTTTTAPETETSTYCPPESSTSAPAPGPESSAPAPGPESSAPAPGPGNPSAPAPAPESSAAPAPGPESSAPALL
ncbi:hypothetical protein E0198_004714 [Clavispora lusitaniae]|nr:hypothetical protein E0198_004714 [Clavispora lusitaniae]